MNINNENIGHPYKTPNGYFEKLEKEILSKTIDNQTITIENKKKIWKLWPFGIAASLLIVTGIFYQNFETNNQKTEKEINQLSQSQTIAYLENENIDLQDIETIIENDSTKFDDIDAEFLPQINTSNQEFTDELEKGIIN